MVVPHEFVERDKAVGELPARGGKKLRRRSVAAKETGDMIGRAAHQTECRLSPGFREQAARPQVGMAAWNLPGALHRLAGLGRAERHALAQFRHRGNIVEVGDGAYGAAKCRMGGNVFDALAVDKDPPSISERAKILSTRAHRQFSRLDLFSPSTASVSPENADAKRVGEWGSVYVGLVTAGFLKLAKEYGGLVGRT